MTQQTYDSISILDTPIFSYTTFGNEKKQGTLIGIITELWQDNILSLDGLQTHQYQPFYCFVVQLVSMAILNSDAKDETYAYWKQLDGASWKQHLLQLSNGIESAWNLVESDQSKPAFLQSPSAKDDTIAITGKDYIYAPDQLDYLVTSKNHDVKMARVWKGSLESWCYALISTQTMSGYSGAGSTQIMRMNGGISSRCFFGVSTSLNIGQSFIEDVYTLCTKYTQNEDNMYGLFTTPKHTLLWLPVWNGSVSLPIQEVHPFCIEICKRIRLSWHNNDIVAYTKTVKELRVDARDFCGNVADPWLPCQIDLKKKTIKSVSLQKLDYRDIQKLFTNEYIHPIAMTKESRTNQYLTGSVLVRGQGTTDGYHQKHILIPPTVILTARNKPVIGQVSKDLIDQIDKGRKVLTQGLKILFDGSFDHKDSPTYEKMRDYFSGVLHREIDTYFFQYVWDIFGLQESKAGMERIGEKQKQWRDCLCNILEDLLKQAINSYAPLGIKGISIVAQTENIFYSKLQEFRGV